MARDTESELQNLYGKLNNFRESLEKQRVDLEDAGLFCSRIPDWIYELDLMIEITTRLLKEKQNNV